MINGTCLRRDVLAVIRCPDDLVYGNVEALQDSLLAAFGVAMSGFKLKYSLLEGNIESALDWEVEPQDRNEVDLTW